MPHPARSIFVSTLPGSRELHVTPSGALLASSALNMMSSSFDREYDAWSLYPPFSN